MTRGRKSKLNREMISRIAKHIQDGVHPDVAARACGISEPTYYRWLAFAETRGGLYKEFKERIETATAKAEASIVKNVRVHAKRSGKVGLEMLGRRWPKRWAEQQKTEIGVSEDLAALMDKANKLRGEDPRIVPLADGEVLSLPPVPETVGEVAEEVDEEEGEVVVERRRTKKGGAGSKKANRGVVERKKTVPLDPETQKEETT